MVGRLASDPETLIDGLSYWQPGIRSEREAAAEALARLQEASANYATQFGKPYLPSDDKPFTLISEDPLKEWSITTRTAVLNSTHAVYARNPMANSIVQFTADFSVGRGFTLNCQNALVQEILEDFINDPDNAIRELERQLVIDLQVDGEIILRFFSEGGRTVIVPQRPWELKWIRTELGFFRRPISYHFEYALSEGDASGGAKREEVDVPAEEILFTAINRHSYELRGRPDLYRLLPWLRADVEFLSDRARQAKFRGSLLWWVKVSGATQAMLSAAISRWKTPPPTGSVYVSTDREEVVPLGNPANAGDANEDGRAIRMMSILGARMAEYFFGNGENANLASANRQQLPTLTKFDGFQDIMKHQVFEPMFRRVIQNAVAARLLPEQVEVQDADGAGMGEYVPAERAFEVIYDPVSEQSLGELSAMLSNAVANFGVSIQSAQERLGFDPAQERDRKAREDQSMMSQMGAGLVDTPPAFLRRAADASAPEETPSDAVESQLL